MKVSSRSAIKSLPTTDQQLVISMLPWRSTIMTFLCAVIFCQQWQYAAYRPQTCLWQAFDDAKPVNPAKSSQYCTAEHLSSSSGRTPWFFILLCVQVPLFPKKKTCWSHWYNNKRLICDDFLTIFSNQRLCACMQRCLIKENHVTRRYLRHTGCIICDNVTTVARYLPDMFLTQLFTFLSGNDML